MNTKFMQKEMRPVVKDWVQGLLASGRTRSEDRGVGVEIATRWLRIQIHDLLDSCT